MSSRIITDTSWENLEQQATDIVIRITTLEDDDPNKLFLHKELGRLRYVQFQLSNDLEYLEQAVSSVREAIQIVPAGTLLLGDFSSMLAVLLSARYKYQKRQKLQLQMSEDLSDQIEQFSAVLTTIPDGDKNLPEFQSILADMYFDRSLRAGDGQSLDSAATFTKKALESTVKSDKSRGSLEKAYQKILMYQNINPEMSISDAMELSHSQARAVSRDTLMSAFDNPKSSNHLKQKEKTWVSLDIGGRLLDEYQASNGDSAVLDRATKIFENLNTHEDLSDDDALRAMILHGLANCFRKRYEIKGVKEDLHRALEFAEEAKKLVPANHEERKYILRHLASLQRLLWQCTSQTEYLDKAIENFREPVRLAQNDGSDQADFLHDLGMALYNRSELLNNLEDRKAAEEKIKKAIAGAPSRSQKQGFFMIQYANMLHTSYEETNNLDHLELAIKKALEAKELLPERHPSFPQVCCNIGTFYSSKFLRLEHEEDLREAITFARQAVKMAPKNSSDRGDIVASLAPKLGIVYDLTGNIKALEEGISLIREAMSSLPAEHRSIPIMKRNLGGLLLTSRGDIMTLEKAITSHDQSASTFKLDDLDETMECYEQALKLYVKTDRDYGTVSLILAILLSIRVKVNQNYVGLERARGLFLEGVENVASPPLTRVSAARAALESYANIRGTAEWKDQLAKIALDVLPYACSRELSREDQQHAIESTHGFAAEICTLSIQLGKIEEALQRVEYGRGLILGHLIDRKDDLAGLKEKHPEFARTYQELRHRAFRQIKTEKLSESWESMMEDRRKAHSMMRECEKEIRRKPGFKNFQLPPPLEELRKSAADGPIVIVNVAYDSSDAIILTTSHLKTIPLPDMARDVPEIFQRVLGRYRSRARSFLEPHRDVEKDVGEPHSTQLLTWLWYSCVLPVLVKLQELGALPETSGDPPRVWWIGSGAASSLPFHAAGDFDEICRVKPSPDQDLGGLRLTCMDWVTPSYAPTIKALQYARARADKLNLAEKPSILVVAMPETPGQSNLTGVVEERLAVQESATGFCVESPLEYPSAAKVLERLQGSSVAHFACHGMSDSVNPDASHILLQRRDSTGKIVPDQLTVGAILDATNQSGTGSWLVYLSACSTAQVKAKEMEDENIHLASAFQIAGFVHAIGSLWSAEDSICVEVARIFYEELSKYSGEERKFAVAYALRKAVMSVRSQNYQNPALWAPFIHFGA